MTESIIAVDIGTTSTKVVAYDLNANALASANHGYPLAQTSPGMAEQAPADLLTAVQAGVQEVLTQVDATQVIGLSFSGAMHSLVLTDMANQPLTQIMTWADNRPAAIVDQLHEPATAALLRQTGVPIHPMTPFAKLLWLNQTQPGLVARAAHVLDLKSYLFAVLTGQYVMDYSTANATGLFFPGNKAWAPDLLALAGVEAKQLPTLVETTAHVPLSVDGAALLNLPAGLPLVLGATDGPLSNLGLGAIRPGDETLTIGTSAALRTTLHDLQLDASGQTFSYYLAPGYWVNGGPVNNGGNVLNWLQQVFDPSQEADYPALLAEAAEAPANAHHLVFLPYLHGERAPLWDSNAFGSYLGLTAQHTRADLIRAAVEGMLFNLKLVDQKLQLAGSDAPLFAAGGFAQSPFWCQLTADILNRSLNVLDGGQSSARGAAAIGLLGLGRWDSLAQINQEPSDFAHYAPNPEVAAQYEQWWPHWQHMFKVMATEYDAFNA